MAPGEGIPSDPRTQLLAMEALVAMDPRRFFVPARLVAVSYRLVAPRRLAAEAALD